MKSSNSGALSPRASLQTQLNIVNKAIEIAATKKQKSPSKRKEARSSSAPTSLIHSSSSPQLIDAFIGSDESFVIRTTGMQPVVCPDCLLEIDSRAFKMHQARQCPNKVVTCPNVGCGHKTNLQNLRWHLQEECSYAMQRKHLLQQASVRAQHKEELEKAKFMTYLQMKKSEKIIEVAATAYGQLDPAVEEKAKEPVVLTCPQCGEAMRESQLALHMAEVCNFRKIMCPNYGFGCHETSIPLNGLQEHLNHVCRAEKAKEQLIAKCKERKEFVFCSTCGEEVQLCYFRQHNREKCPNRLVPCRNHHLGCSVLVPLRERHLHEHIDDGYARFSTYFPGHGSYMLLDETDIVAPWTAEFWIYRPPAHYTMRQHLKNALLQIPSYELFYCSEVLLKNKVLHVVNELKAESNRAKERKDEMKSLNKAERALRQSELMKHQVNLVNELQALIPVYSDTVVAYVKAFQNMAICLEAALACVRDTHTAKHIPHDDEESFTLENICPGEVAAEKAEIPAYMQSKDGSVRTKSVHNSNDASTIGEQSHHDEEEATLASSARGSHQTSRTHSVQRIVLEEKDENSTAASQMEGIDGTEEIDMSTEHKREEQDVEKEHIDVRVIEEDINMPPLTSFQRKSAPGELSHVLFSGLSNFAKLVRYAWSVVQTEDGIPFPEEQADLMEKEENIKEELVRYMSEYLEYSLLPDFRVAKFICDWIEFPSRATKSHAFNLAEWKSILDLLAFSLKSDFDRLQDWRMEAGLVTPEPKSADEDANKKLKAVAEEQEEKPKDDKKEKALKKKEKERQRREMKKLKDQKAAEESAAGAEGAVEGEVKDEANEADNKPKPKEVKLITRITEVLKSGSGAEIINESSSENHEGNRSHVCVCMYSGLGILKLQRQVGVHDLLTGSSAANAVDHHYELLIPEKEFNRLANMNGNVGFVVCSDKNSKHFEVVGNQALVTSTRVPRGKWTHFALIVTTAPQNKVTCYMDGVYVGSFRDCSFPLPMLSVGGSPYSLFTFTGSILDVRYWCYQRSAHQISDNMHRLVPLEQAGTKSNEPRKRGEPTVMVVNNGMIGWWTFDDGPGFKMVTDVTRNRFKTPIDRKMRFHIPSDSGPRHRYPIPFDVVTELNRDLLSLLPPEEHPESLGIELDEEPSPSRPDTGVSAVSEKNHVTGKYSSLTKCQMMNAKFQWLVAESIPVYNSPPPPGSEATSEETAKKAKEKKTKAKTEKSKSPAKSPKKSTTAANPYKTTQPKLPFYLLQERNYGGENSNLLPVPSFRENNLCPFELRRHRLAKSGRELQKLVACQLGCNEMIRSLNMRFHVRYECPRRLVSCRFDCCSAIFPFEQRDSHEQKDCVLAASRLKLLSHAVLTHGTITCPQCSNSVKIRELEKHNRYECVHRLVFCVHPDCSYGIRNSFDATVASNTITPSEDGGVSTDTSIVEPKPRIPFHLLERHLQYECDSAEVTKRFILIERSRVRHEYPRPWGICIPIRKKLKKIVSSTAKNNGPEATSFDDSDNEGIEEVDGEQKEGDDGQDHRGIKVHE